MGNQQAPQNPPKKIQRPPQIINGYSIGKKLGSGGFGDVFEAYKNNNVYAIKTPKQSFQDYQQNMQEALMMTSIESEHFVKVYEYFVFKNRFFIVMEKCDMDLETKLKNSNLTLQQRINYCTQIIEGVNYLHCNKIAHRDLKPKNILIKNGAIKISDLGLAMFISRLRCQTICGTYDYMAPQRFKGQAFNQAIDTYALGLILLIILSGKTIQYFQGYGFVGCLEQFPKQQYLNLIQDQFFREIVRGCLKRNPCERKSVPNIASQLLIRKMQINNSQKTNLSQISQSKIISEITAENNPYQNSQQVQNYEIYINQQIRAYIDLCSQI